MTRPVRAALVAVVLVFTALPAAGAPLQFPSFKSDGFGRPSPPLTTAAAWILYDATVGVVLAELNADAQRAPASITKIMTALLAIENGDLDELVTVSARAAATGEREIDLVPGEQVTLGALVKAAMVHSANDASTAIAEHLGGSVSGFAEMMNARAAELGMTTTNFVNPHGLDAPGHLTTARDMLRLANAAMENPVFRDIARARLMTFPVAPDESRRIGMSTNLLLEDYDGANGIKTGFTNRALLTFVASAERDGRQLIAVILGTEARRSHFDVARTLFDYGFDDLRVYGAVGGLAYRSKRLRVEPDPMTATGAIEAHVHLAGEGLFARIPRRPADLPDLPPPPAETTRRHPDGPAQMVEALVFWLDRLFSP
jgi:serine-type D-Ala-D-Ala carboxypeptidase (penicillin-binding protein 5/6)